MSSYGPGPTGGGMSGSGQPPADRPRSRSPSPGRNRRRHSRSRSYSRDRSPPGRRRSSRDRSPRRRSRSRSYSRSRSRSPPRGDRGVSARNLTSETFNLHVDFSLTLSLVGSSKEGDLRRVTLGVILPSPTAMDLLLTTIEEDIQVSRTCWSTPLFDTMSLFSLIMLCFLVSLLSH